MTDPSQRRPPLVLIINDQEWSTRSLESILGPNGYAVFRAYTASKGLERALSSRPDVIVVGESLPDLSGLEVCRQLRSDPRISDSTPIIMTTTARPTRNERLAALRAGAWDFVGHPLDAEELLLRFDVFVRAKHDADQARDEGLLDALTGLYNLQGLSRRARELSSQAYRLGAPLACVVLSAEAANGGMDGRTEEVVRRLADMLRTGGRVSDAVGRIGEAEFAVFAPSTDAAGAAHLAERIVKALEEDELADDAIYLLAGYHAVEDYRAASIQPRDMLERASAALRRSRKSDPGQGRIQAFDGKVATLN